MIDEPFKIIKEDGNEKAKVHNDGFGIELLTMRNGYQWTGQPMTPNLAKLTIEVLQEYINENSD